MLLQKYLIEICKVIAYRDKIFDSEFIEDSYYIIAFFFCALIARKRVYELFDVDFKYVVKRRVYFFFVLYPCRAVIAYAENIHYRKVIPDHEVYIHNRFDSVEKFAFALERVDKPYDFRA